MVLVHLHETPKALQFPLALVIPVLHTNSLDLSLSILC